jgi:hypothetical protein
MYDDSPVDQPANRSPFEATHALSPSAPYPNSGGSGTVAATIEAHDPHHFAGASSGLITRGALSLPKQAAGSARPQFRPKDLLDEVQAINSQIHQIMFQVEKAVSRLSSGS